LSLIKLKPPWRRASLLIRVGGSELRMRTRNDLTGFWTRFWRNIRLHQLRGWNPAVDELWSQWAMVYLLGRVHGHGLGMRISGIADGVITDRQIAGSWLWIEDSRTGEAQ
jgi:hypothetical protein